MEKREQVLEKELAEIRQQKEQTDRWLLKLEWVVGGLSILVLFIPILIAAYVPMGEWTRLLIVFSGFIPALIGFIYAVKIEQMAGYYECAKCKHRYVPTLKAACWASHKGRTRNMKCPACGEKSWQKKVITKE